MNIKIDNEYMQMQQALQSQYSSINVQNTNSDLNRFYHMNVPFQLTLEYCSGSELEDYINIMTLSAEKSLMYQESAATKNFARTKDVMHYHDFFEFVIVLEGSIVQKIEGKDYLYAAGSCCLINRSLCHLEHYHAKTKVLFIGMSPEFVSELFKSAQNSAFSAEKKICNGEIYQFITDDLKYPGKKAYLDFKVSLDTNSDFLLFSRISHLFEESNGRMSRAELEHHLNYSGDYLNRIVNKYSGLCLYDYGMTFCLKKAAQYLTETNESIGSIATRLQFTNRTHFYSLFKQKYGVTPKEYRQSH